MTIPLFRAGVICTLRDACDMEVVGEGATAEDAICIASTHLPDVILLDIGMPGGGVEAARAIRETCSSVKAAMLTASESERHVTDLLRCGVNGYILKGSSGPGLLQMGRSVRNGGLFITSSLAARLLAQTSVPNRREQCAAQSARADTPAGAGSGIAVEGPDEQGDRPDCLHVTEKTVKNYMTELMLKLKARNRVEAALIARERNATAHERIDPVVWSRAPSICPWPDRAPRSWALSRGYAGGCGAVTGLQVVTTPGKSDERTIP